MTYLPKPFKIIGTEKQTKEVKLLKVRYDLNPLPGQFFQVSVPGFGECPLASCSFNSKEADILLRNVGNVSGQIFNLKKEDYVYIRGPYGKGFPVKELESKDLILVGGGTGIAPITSLIEYIKKNRSRFGKIDIYFGFRDKENILLKNKISEWREEFNVFICISEGKNMTCNLKCEEGFIQDIMKNKIGKIENSSACICGPEVMMDCVSDLLIENGMSKKDIFWSMERRMECAIGICNRCLIQDIYVCKDGPVFSYDIIKPRIENEKSAN